jgi:hypothetical protein
MQAARCWWGYLPCEFQREVSRPRRSLSPAARAPLVFLWAGLPLGRCVINQDTTLNPRDPLVKPFDEFLIFFELRCHVRSPVASCSSFEKVTRALGNCHNYQIKREKWLEWFPIGFARRHHRRLKAGSHLAKLRLSRGRENRGGQLFLGLLRRLLDVGT